MTTTAPRRRFSPGFLAAMGAVAGVVGCSLLAVGTSGGSAAPAAPHTPVAGERIGTSPLDCDVTAMGDGLGGTYTAPLCTETAIAAQACDLDVSDVEPYERYSSTGGTTLWTDGVHGRMVQFSFTFSPEGSTTELVCQSDGRRRDLMFSDAEWSRLNRVGTLSPTMQAKLADA